MYSTCVHCTIEGCEGQKAMQFAQTELPWRSSSLTPNLHTYHPVITPTPYTWLHCSMDTQAHSWVPLTDHEVMSLLEKIHHTWAPQESLFTEACMADISSNTRHFWEGTMSVQRRMEWPGLLRHSSLHISDLTTVVGSWSTNILLWHSCHHCYCSCYRREEKKIL